MKVLILAGHGGGRGAKLLDAIYAHALLEWSWVSARIPGQKERT